MQRYYTNNKIVHILNISRTTERSTFRYLFWTEVGDIPRIGRANMDGTSKIFFATTTIRLPHYLAIDYKCYVRKTSFQFTLIHIMI